MPDAYYEDDRLAELYDRIEQRLGPDEQFYLRLARDAERVLDIGCGTGTMLHHLRDTGHRGRLVGLDPAAGMIARARRRDDVDWVHGHLGDAGFEAEFDLAYMTGHAFQVLLTDTDVTDLLVAVRRALAPGGRFAFETRDPAARAWERWTPDDVREVVDGEGRTVRVWHDVEAVEGEFVTFTETFETDGEQDVSRSTLRFLTATRLDAMLTGAGFAVAERFGDWDGGPITPHTREIVTVAVPQ